MKKLLCIIGIILFVTTGCKISKKGQNMDNVSSIYIRHSGFGINEKEYKVDLVEEKFYWFYVEDLFNPVERDEDSQNEGFQGVSDLSKDKVNIFRQSLNKMDFLSWEDSYFDPDIQDGDQWGIVIHFDNGERKATVGSNEYPSTWEKIGDEFEKLIGKRVF